MSKVFVSLLCLCISLAAFCAEPAKPAPSGPLVEVTPQTGDAFTGYLLSMKDGTLDVQLESGETKEAKTSDVKSVRFVPPPEPPAVKEAPPAEAPPRETPADVKKREERRDEMKQFHTLLAKLRDGSISAAEEEDLSRLGQQLYPLLRGLGSNALPAIKQFENIRTEVKKESGHLEVYVAKQREVLKGASSENVIREEMMRLVCAYHQEGKTFKEMEEQLTSDMALLPVKHKKLGGPERVRHWIDLMFILNGEKILKPEKEK
jgi:hypothetical protein